MCSDKQKALSCVCVWRKVPSSGQLEVCCDTTKMTDELSQQNSDIICASF